MKGQKKSIERPRLSRPDSPADHETNLFRHELGNVLHGLLGLARLLRNSELDASQQSWVAAIEESGQQLHRLAATVSCSQAVDRPASAPVYERIDGLEFLERTLVSHVPSALAAGNRLVLIIDPSLPRFWRCDPGAVRQLLDNLLANANRFTRSGKVVLEAGREPGEEDTGPLLIRIRDSGHGIPPAMSSRLFEPYATSKPGNVGVSGGKGLGLYVCEKAAAGLGGNVIASAPPGGGSCFEIRLPGVLLLHEQRRRQQFRGLSRIQCQLDIHGELEKSVAGFLARLGVPFLRSGHAGGANAGRCTVIVIRPWRPASGRSLPGLELTPLASSSVSGARRIAGPVGYAELVSSLLELALGEISRGEIPG